MYDGGSGTNLSLDPKFVDPASNDFKLKDISPAIGSGTSSGIHATDILGNARPNPNGSNPDMGAYENALGVKSPPPSVTLTTSSATQFSETGGSAKIVASTSTTALENVTVKAALDAILKPNNYSYFVQGNIIIVKDLDTQLIGELESVVVRLKYINSNDLQGPLSTVLTSRGTIQSFLPVATLSGTTGPPNMAIISDVQENIARILNLVKQLDKPIANINISINNINYIYKY